MMRKWFHEYIEIPIWQTALCQELLGQGLFPPSNRKDSLSQVLSHNSVLFFFNSACKVVLVVKNLPANADVSLIPGLGRSLEEEMATHSSILAWRIPWTKQPGRLQSMGSQRVGHD